MVETFKAEEKSIRKLFQEKISYHIPSYQRPYCWEREEIEKFCEDIILSYKNNEEYLLSSIILVEKKREKLYEVIDGQQRLTTISIFLAVLKSFLKKQDNINDVNNRILNGTEIRVQRVQTNKSFHQDFQEVLQNFDYNTFKAWSRRREYKNNNYYQNAIIIHEFLSNDDSQIDFDEFYENFFIDRVFLISVNTALEQKAMKLFEVLNSRGLPLKNADLIKNHIMEKIYESYEEENKEAGIGMFEDLWDEISQGLEDLDETTEELFTYYVYMKLKENPKNNLFEEFKRIIKRDFDNEHKIDKFIAEFEDFYQTYLSLFKERKDVESYRKIHSMRYLREGRFWKTILVSFILKNPSEDIKEITDILFQFYFLNFISGESVNPYKQFSFNLIRDIVEGTLNIERLKADINNYYKKQNTLYRFKSKIKGDIYSERWSKVLFYLIEYFKYKDQEDFEIFEQNNNKIQIEHIFPRNEKYWKDIIKKEPDMRKYKNTLGNLTLLYQSNNVKCSNSEFKIKLGIYNKSQKFNHTKEILKFDKWNTENILRREKMLLEQIELIFNLPQDTLFKELEITGEELITDIVEVSNSDDLNNIYNSIKDRIFDLGEDIDEIKNKHYIAFKRKIGKNRNFVSIRFQKDSLKIYIPLEEPDPKKWGRNVSDKGHLGTGDYEFTLNAIGQLDYLIDLIRQSYDKSLEFISKSIKDEDFIKEMGNYRQMMKKGKEDLSKNYLEWAKKIVNSKVTVHTWQGNIGDEDNSTICYFKWVMKDKTKITLSFGLWKKINKPANLGVELFVAKPSGEFQNKFKEKNLIKKLLDLGFTNLTKVQKNSWFIKENPTENINDESIKEFILKEMPKVQPLMEEIFK